MSIDNDGLDGLGEKLKELLGGALPPGMSIEDVKVMKVPGGSISGAPRLRPATLAHLQGLLEGTAQPKFEIGDIVVLRPWAANRFKWPKADDRCIVTQVLDAPYRSGDAGTQRPAVPENIALGFVDDEGNVHEFLHDSRMFVKVGSIYDPIELPNGEKLPVE